jgi:GAF domain-containing protein
VNRPRIDHQALLAGILDAVAASPTARDAMTRSIELLKAGVPDYTWVGIYLLEGEELVLGPYLGAPSPHTRIPLGRGICGAAATAGQTIIVDDVHADPRYLACSLETRSEIVVPILKETAVLGEIDIDSNAPAAFDASDQRMLEAIAGALAHRL